MHNPPKQENRPDTRRNAVDAGLVHTAQTRIAEVLNEEWLDGYGGTRVYRAVYHHPKHGWRVAQLIQRRGLSGFDIGIVRDVSEGGQAQLKAYAMSTLEAVIWTGIYLSDTAYSWEFVL